MNTKVTVTGMQVKAVVNDNLLIAGDTLDSTAKKADNLFSNSLTQEVKGILEPVSTINGTTFFYTATNNVYANGDAIADTYLPYATTGLGDATDTTNYTNAFSQNYGVSKSIANARITGQDKAVGYVDYVFQLKATNTQGSAAPIKLTKLDFTYTQTGSEVENTKAYRVAFFVEDITDGTATAAPGTINAIYTVSGADNFTSGKAVKDATTVDDLSTAYATAAVDLASVPATTTKYYKVVVRLWLEGEDNTCNNETFMLLTGQWALDLEMELGSTATGVANITKITATP
ncbi:MAG: hypothetical protein IJU52_04335 [Clostridia bacterium]|nr:hypothetical protein [Clostridia bacterium]